MEKITEIIWQPTSELSGASLFHGHRLFKLIGMLLSAEKAHRYKKPYDPEPLEYY